VADPNKNVSLEGLSADEINGLAALGVSLTNNPKTRKEFFKLVKTVNPDASVPELDADEAIATATAAQNKRLDAMENKQREDDARARLAALKDEPVIKGLITKDEIPELEKYMKERGFTPIQYVQAAQLRQAEMRAAEPTPGTFQPTAVLPGDKDLRKDSRAWARKAAADAINDIKAGKVAGLRH
jgi:hypothetical protein